jgi:hypothetical protein
MVWRAVIANELLPDLANSFLVVASKDVSSLAKLDPAYLASAYTGDRLPRFATETTFRKADDDRIIVEKRLLFPEKRNDEPISFHHDRLLHHVDTVAEYIPGELYVVELQRRLARGEGIDSVADWARDWLSILRAEADENFSTLPGKRLDAIPQNFIRAVDGTLQHIDDEWGLTCAIPLSWVVVRGLVNAFGVSPTSAALAGLTLREAISRVAGSAGLLLDEADFQKASELEAELRLVICGQDKAKTLDDLLKSFSLSPRCALGAPTLPEWFSAENSQLSAEIARVKSTVSWQITKPLRFLAFLWRKLVHADRLS